MVRKFTVAVAALATVGLLWVGTAEASGGECTGFCGTPQQSGGGCGCGGGSILVNNTDLGDTYQYADDFDNDGIEDDFDNCPFVANLAQADADGDGIGDLCDSCVSTANAIQMDVDGDGLGDACDDDIDNDGVPNALDNCQLVPNPKLVDTDGDGQGDACDLDDDDDGVVDIKDNCPLIANPDQLNTDPNRFGDACDEDADLDNVPDSKDNCINVPNPDQLNTNVTAELAAGKAALGDACDPDIDGDGVMNLVDNCKLVANPLQENGDRDALGDACDPKFCYVVRSGLDATFDETNCLDPTATFRVFAPDTVTKTGEPVRLRLFANRQDRAIDYTWVVTKRPSGSASTVENPRGLVNASSTFEYFYLKGNVARFTPDEPGTYQIKLTAKLQFPDTANPSWPQDAKAYVMTVTAEGEGAGGCAVAGDATSGTAMGLLLLGLLGLVLLRRRK